MKFHSRFSIGAPSAHDLIKVSGLNKGLWPKKKMLLASIFFSFPIFQDIHPINHSGIILMNIGIGMKFMLSAEIIRVFDVHRLESLIPVKR